MSQLSNHSPELLDNFEYGGGFVTATSSPPTKPREGLVFVYRCEWFLKYIRGGRYLSQPFNTRSEAALHAAQLLCRIGNDEVTRVNVLTLLEPATVLAVAAKGGRS